MNYFGAYHADIRSRALDSCDAPRISKGQMTVAGYETASNERAMALVYGRMRNRRALAKRLECTPYASQAALALRAYEIWGEDFPRHIEGPCVCCVADVKRDVLLLSRDRMGECCLFYACREGALMFADHPDTILKAAFVEPVLDRGGLCELIGLGPARTPGRTPLRNIRSLEPGSVLICNNEGIHTRRYFELRVREHREDPLATVWNVRELLEQAINEVVPLHPACMLSGGVDSTALTALLCARIGRVESFSVDYAENAADFVPNAFRPEMDAPYIRLAARVFGTRHHNVVLDQEALADGLDQAVRLRGFPGMGDVDSSLMLFAKEILRCAGTVVSGECGDEVFGGYPWFRGEVRLPEDSFPWSGSIELREHVLRPDIRKKLGLRGYVRDVLHNALDSYDVGGVPEGQERNLFLLQRLCFDFFMPNLQERAVKMCEGQGLTVLTPLCDDRLVQYVYSVPWNLKRMGGVDKGLYREAVRDLLPEKLRMRRKSPYPKTCSAAYADAIRSRVRAMCADVHAPIWSFADRDFVEKLAASALNPADTPWFGQLMAGPQMLAYLLQIDSWMRRRNIAVELD